MCNHVEADIFVWRAAGECGLTGTDPAPSLASAAARVSLCDIRPGAGGPRMGRRVPGDMSKTLPVINCEGFIPGLWQPVGVDLLATSIAVIARHSYRHGKYHRVLNQHKQPGRETVCI